MAELSRPSPAPVARKAGLTYVTDTSPGISRVKRGQRFTYLTARGHTIRNERTLKRIAELVIPPAWANVWICPDPRGHIQATGRDERGRKQYLYHTRWREVRDLAKYDQAIEFAEVLPKIRRQVMKDLKLRHLCREKIVATVVRLLELTLIRIGNEEYARTNKSYGLTTLRRRHVEVTSTHVRFSFRGKSGIAHEIDLKDPRMARIIRTCTELPGQKLFQYRDSDGQLQDITSHDVNEYLRTTSGREITAKDFRTWAGTILAARGLCEVAVFESATAAQKNIRQAIKLVAQKLGNTVSVCRKCYIHPAVIEAYLDQSLVTSLGAITVSAAVRNSCGLTREEKALAKLLKNRQRKVSRAAKSD